MRTHGPREGNITHHGLSKCGEATGEVALGEIPNADDGLMGVANYHGMGIPVLQTCTFHKCISELQV